MYHARAKNQSPGLTIFLPVPIIVRQLINTENRRRHDTFFGAALGPDAAGRGHPAVRYGPHRAGAEHPFHSGAVGGHGDGVHRRRHGGPHRRRGHRRHRHRQLEHLAAPRHPCGTVHRVFDPNRPVPRGRPPAGRPGRAAAVHALQPHPGSGRCGFRRRHQPLPARVAGADISLQADASAYFAIWSAALPSRWPWECTQPCSGPPATP